MMENNKVLFDELKYILSVIIGLQKYSEAKNATLLAACIATITVFAAKVDVGDPVLLLLIVFAGISFLLLSIIVSSLSISPRYDRKKIRYSGDSKKLASPNLYFFGYLCSLDEDGNGLLDETCSALLIDKPDKYEPVMSQLSNQIIIHSRITKDKFDSFKIAFWLYLIGVTLTAMYLICASFVSVQ